MRSITPGERAVFSLYGAGPFIPAYPDYQTHISAEEMTIEIQAISHQKLPILLRGLKVNVKLDTNSMHDEIYLQCLGHLITHSSIDFFNESFYGH